MKYISTKWVSYCCFLLCFSLLSLRLQAQCPTAILAQTSSSANFRGLNPNWGHGCTVFIITQAEMTAAGFVNGSVLTGITGRFATAPSIPTTGTLQVYLENTADATNNKSTTWATAIGTMTQTYNASFTIPNATSWSLTFPSSFTYTGGGIYVAYEWINCGTLATASVVSCNTALATGIKSMQTTGCAAITTIGANSAFRPVVGFISSNTNLSMQSLFPLSKSAKGASMPETIEFSAKNTFATTQNPTATLTVKEKITGTVRYTTSKPITIAGCSSSSSSFSSLSAINAETDSVIIELSAAVGESTLADNRKGEEQIVQDTVISHAVNNLSGTGSVGFNTGAGLLLAKYHTTGIAVVNRVRCAISGSAGNTVYGVVVNSNGVIVGQSANYVIQAGDNGNYVTFNLLTPVTLANTDFYVGLAQTANTTTGYFPILYQSEAPTKNNVFYTTGLGGGGFSGPYTTLSRWMIEAVLVGTTPDIHTTLTSATTLCAGNSISATYVANNLTFNAGNTLALELSNATGSFASPTVLTTLTSSSATGTLTGTVSTNTPAGTGYRVRITASDTAFIGSSNDVNITINRTTSVVSGGGPACSNSSGSAVSIALTGTSPWTFTYTNGTTPTTITANTTNPYTFTTTAAGTYKVTTLSDANCTANVGDRIDSAIVIINTAPSSTVLAMANVANPLIIENFDSGVPSTWTAINHSSPLGNTPWFTAEVFGVFPAFNGASTSYLGANFNSTTGAGTISNWLVMPNITLQNGDVFTFYTRTEVNIPVYPDRLQARMSTNGSSTNVGTLATDVGDFSTLLIDINPTLTTSGYPTVWTQYTATISGLSGATSGRLAFRYFVTNGGPAGNNSDYIGIDAVSYVSTAAAPNTFCNGLNSLIRANITGGTSPYTLIYSDGTSNHTLSNYLSGVNITVTPSSSATYSIVSVTDANGCASSSNTGSLPITVLSGTNAPIPTSAGAHFATKSCLEGSWTYFFENNNLLLGLEMSSWNPGTLVATMPATGQYAVRVDIGASPTANLTTAPYNTSGKDWVVMNRTWDVVLDSVIQEPSDSINVRTYFTDAEYQAVNDIFIAADSLTTPNALTVYKLKRTTPIWQDSAGASSIAYDYSMQALAASHAGLGDSNLVLYNNLSSYAPDWVYTANSPSAGIHTATIKVDEFSGGGGGGGAGGSTPFPIELLYFNGYNGGATNYLSWITATELNSDKFVIERSTDAITFKAIGEVKAVGNSNKQENYAFNDKTFKANQNLYRLRMIDKDGTFAYSNIIEIATDNLNITVYPNPAQNEVFIAGNFAPNFKASMINVLGAEVLNTNLDNQSQTAISLQNITPGVYMLNILNEKGAVIYSEKLVKE